MKYEVLGPSYAFVCFKSVIVFLQLNEKVETDSLGLLSCKKHVGIFRRGIMGANEASWRGWRGEGLGRLVERA